MGRAKLNLEFISKEKSRHLTFQKRKKGLKKKSYEFSTLCGVDTCMIIYGPKQGDHPIEVEIWPEDSEEVRRIITRYKEHSKEERGRRSIDLSDFLEDRKKKIEDVFCKLRRQNDESEYPSWDDRLDEFSDDQLRELVSALEHKLEAVNLKIELVKGKQSYLEDITGMIDYTIPASSYNHSSSSCYNGSNFYQRSMGLDLVQHQPMTHVKPLDHKLLAEYPNEQSLLFDSTPMVAPLNVMNYTDCSQQFIGGCTSNLHNPPLRSPFSCNSTYGTHENVEFNAPRSLPHYYYSPNMQPMLPCLPSTSQIHESQVNEFYILQDLQMKHKRERY